MTFSHKGQQYWYISQIYLFETEIYLSYFQLVTVDLSIVLKGNCTCYLMESVVW